MLTCVVSISQLSVACETSSMEENKRVKYKSSGGENCSVRECLSSRKKLYEWGENPCEIHKGLLNKSCGCQRPYKLHCMPAKPEEVRLQWLKALNRQSPPKRVIVCSLHFLDGKPTVKNPYPQLNLGYKSVLKPGRKSPRKRKFVETSSSDKGIKRAKPNSHPLSTETPLDISNENALTPNCIGLQTQPVMCDKGTMYAHLSLCDHGYSKSADMEGKRNKQCQIDIQTDKATSAVQCTIEQDESIAKQEIKTDTDVLFYAGVTYISFWAIVSTLQKFNSFQFSLPVCDQILLCLLRLRHAMEYEMLARKFKISKSYVGQIYLSWLDIMEEQLGKLIVWLPRETIRACLPNSFKTYPKTTVIIDCAETFIQRFKHLRSRAETYSNYKGHNTAKYLVGIAPHGQIMFISRSYGGRSSDKYITSDSGFLNYLRPGDEV